LYGRYLAPRSKHLDDRIAEIEAGKFNAELEKLKRMGKAGLRRRYGKRDIEPA
jgi:uncharacterized protein YdcH (DUF465 family)